MGDDFFEESGSSKVQRAVIAGAAEALKLRMKDWKKPEADILQDITNRMNEILRDID